MADLKKVYFVMAWTKFAANLFKLLDGKKIKPLIDLWRLLVLPKPTIAL